MLGKTQIKYIQSLRQNRYRQLHGAYVIEGEKIVGEYIARDYPLSNIYAVDDWMSGNQQLLQAKKLNATVVSEGDLKKISTLTTPNKVLAIAAIPSAIELESLPLNKGLHIALEAIRDPGNLGTIIRTADWFGIDSIICSEDCVDAYNPKVIQAAMGSMIRMKTIYVKDLAILKGLSKLPIYAATLSGKNIYHEKLPVDAIILIGNESKGLSEPLIKMSSLQITIPRFGKAESLNAAVATGMLMSFFRSNERKAASL